MSIKPHLHVVVLKLYGFKKKNHVCKDFMILNSFIKDVQPLVIFTLHLVILDQQNILMYSYFQAPSSIYVYTVYIYIYIYIYIYF